jgi:uncharacterized damage-inducible protein DinB
MDSVDNDHVESVYDTEAVGRQPSPSKQDAQPPHPSSNSRYQTPMALLEHFRRQFEYEFWANTEVLRVLNGLPDPPPASTRLLAHIIAAQHLWLARLLNTPPRLAVWPDLTLAECAAELRTAEAAWRTYLDGLSDDDLSRDCSYTNSKGEAWKSSVADILTHVGLHSSYHRGQTALEVRRSGSAPAYTDYVHAVRQGFLD